MKVVTLGSKKKERLPDEGVLQLLANLAARAQAGEINGLAVAWTGRDENDVLIAGTGYESGVDAGSLLGEVTVLQTQLTLDLMQEDDE